jgi:bacterioferritin
MSEFLTDIETLRSRARENIDKGPVTDAYKADLPRVLDVLQQALATELICVLRYRQHYYAATGLNSEPVAAEFLEHALEEQGHADKIAERISQLGGSPDFNPETLTSRSHSEYTTADELMEMVKENLVAERIAVASYTEIIEWLGEGDPTTKRMLEEILAVEEEHAEDLLSFMSRLG